MDFVKVKNKLIVAAYEEDSVAAVDIDRLTLFFTSKSGQPHFRSCICP